MSSARPIHFAALLGGNAALALGPLWVRLADSGPVSAGFWRLALAIPFFVLAGAIMAEGGIIASKSEGRRLVQQGGLLLGDAKVTDLDAVLTAQDFTDGSVLLRKGKKSYFRLVLE